MELPYMTVPRTPGTVKPPDFSLDIAAQCMFTDLCIRYARSTIRNRGLERATLYGALAMLPLGWATAGYVLVSRAPSSPEKGTPR
jgi:hypothetical protein